MGDFVYKYSKSSFTKDRGHDPVTRNIFNPQQENNTIGNHAVDEIILQENNIVSAEAEAHENIESELDENDIYHIDSMSLDDRKEKIELHKRVFGSEI